MENTEKLVRYPTAREELGTTVIRKETGLKKQRIKLAMSFQYSMAGVGLGRRH